MWLRLIGMVVRVGLRIRRDDKVVNVSASARVAGCEAEAPQLLPLIGLA